MTAANSARGGGCCGRRCRGQSAASHPGCSTHQGLRRLQPASTLDLHVKFPRFKDLVVIRMSSDEAPLQPCARIPAVSAPGGYGLGGKNMCSVSVAWRRRGTWGPPSGEGREFPLSEGLVVVADGQSPVRHSSSRAWIAVVRADVCSRNASCPVGKASSHKLCAIIHA